MNYVFVYMCYRYCENQPGIKKNKEGKKEKAFS